MRYRVVDEVQVADTTLSRVNSSDIQAGVFGFKAQQHLSLQGVVRVYAGFFNKS